LPFYLEKYVHKKISILQFGQQNTQKNILIQ